MTLFQTLFVPLCGMISLAVLVRTLRGHGLRRNGLVWAAVWLAAAGLIAFPGATQGIARLLGIGRGADLVLYLAILSGLATSLYFYTRFRRLEATLTGILRREALNSPQRGSARESIAESASPNRV